MRRPFVKSHNKQWSQNVIDKPIYLSLFIFSGKNYNSGHQLSLSLKDQIQQLQPKYTQNGSLIRVSPDWPPLVSLLVHHVSTYAVRLNLYSCWARIVFTERNLSQDHVWGSTFQHHWENGHFVTQLFCFILFKRISLQNCKTSYFEFETNSPPLKYSNRAIR